MSSDLKSNEVAVHADRHRNKAIKLTNKLNTLQAELQQLRNEGAFLSEINKKKQEIQDTNSRATSEMQMAGKLDAKALLDILVATNVQDAVQAIEQANKQVEEAVEKIKSIRRVFEYIDLFIRLGGAIVSAATTGTPAAQIKAIVEAISILYQTDFP